MNINAWTSSQTSQKKPQTKQKAATWDRKGNHPKESVHPNEPSPSWTQESGVVSHHRGPGHETGRFCSDMREHMCVCARVHVCVCVCLCVAQLVTVASLVRRTHDSLSRRTEENQKSLNSCSIYIYTYCFCPCMYVSHTRSAGHDKTRHIFSSASTLSHSDPLWNFASCFQTLPYRPPSFLLYSEFFIKPWRWRHRQSSKMGGEKESERERKGGEERGSRCVISWAPGWVPRPSVSFSPFPSTAGKIPRCSSAPFPPPPLPGWPTVRGMRRER